MDWHAAWLIAGLDSALTLDSAPVAEGAGIMRILGAWPMSPARQVVPSDTPGNQFWESSLR